MVSDLSKFNSDQGVSELTGSTEQELFHRKWEKVINSGMEKEDLTFLNPMASRMLKRDDAGIQTVNRLQKELGELNARLPKRSTISGIGGHLKRIMTRQPGFNGVGAII